MHSCKKHFEGCFLLVSLLHQQVRTLRPAAFRSRFFFFLVTRGSDHKAHNEGKKEGETVKQ